HTIGFSLALGLLLALASAYVLARQIAGPIRRLALATRRVQDGDYSVEIGVPSGDEIGMLSQAFQSLVADLKEKAKERHQTLERLRQHADLVAGVPESGGGPEGEGEARRVHD